MGVQTEALLIPPSLDMQGLERLAARVGLADASSSTAVVLVRAEADEGPFCQGLALQALDDLPSGAADTFAQVLLRLRTLRRPTIAVVRGDAMGGGLGIAGACDVVVASERARFGLPECTFGLVPAIVLPFLSERAPLAHLRRLALLGDSLSAREAEQLRLVDRVVPDDAVDLEVARTARRLSRAAPKAVEILKRTTAETSALASAARSGAAITESLACSTEVADRIQRFLHDGAAPWEVTG